MRKWLIGMMVGVVCTLHAGLYLPHQYHILAARAVDGTSFEIEDGSQFAVERGHENYLLNWRSDDPITICQHNSCFANTKYYILNKKTGDYINAQLKLGPMINSEYTKRIIGIDYYYGELLLEDGRGYRSSWLVDEADRYLIGDWLVNHAIIIGSNEGWFSGWFSSCDCILIDVERNRSVRAREY